MKIPRQFASSIRLDYARSRVCNRVFPLASLRHKSTRSVVCETHLNELKILSERLSPGVQFSSNRYELDRHGRGEGFQGAAVCSSPDMIARPTTVQQVQEILKFCMEMRVPVIPYGAGTSVEGHVAALNGGLSLDTSLLQDMILPTIEDGDNVYPDPIATVGAGVTRKALNNALRHTGLQFVVDPGADASLGGMVATGASGTTTMRYGGMRENLLAIECVLANGDPPAIVHAGTRALKNSAGYDLVSLMCGSEGTLGVITSVTVKLHPIPQHLVAAVCVFPTLGQAAQAVAALKFNDIPLSRCELLDATSVEAVNLFKSPDHKHLHGPREEKPTLFLEFQGPSEASLQEQVSMTEAICIQEHGGANFEFASSEEDRKALWSVRHALYNACLALRPGAECAIVTDACVPNSHFAALTEATVADVKQLDVVGPCFGHAGDGNLHCIMPLLDDDTPDYLNRVFKVKENLVERTLQVGGTCTGEHGIGCGKIKYLEKQYGPETVGMMKLIKRALDPCNIMNPGKVLPSD